jgi:glycosyltransferase involved in cell wall biosynthesis
MKEKKIKLLLIVPRFGTVNRGVESFAKELVSRLDKNQFDLTVLSGNHDEIVENVSLVKKKCIFREQLKFIDRFYLVTLFLRVFGFGSSSEIESFTLCLNSIRFFWKKDFDIVIPIGGSWTYRFSNFFYTKAKIISIGHAGPVLSDINMSDIFIALTPYDKEIARKLNPEKTVHVIPNGVDFQKFNSNSIGIKLNDSQVVILCAAALVPEKRHDLLFNAVLNLPDNVVVLCVGSGPNYEILKSHPLYLKGRVSFENVEYEEMPAIYKCADIFSLASPDETFGIVFIEAVASGLPVVANQAERQKFVVGPCGVLCDVYDENLYSLALRKVMGMRISKRVKDSHLKTFDWNHVIKEYELILKTIL